MGLPGSSKAGARVVRAARSVPGDRPGQTPRILLTGAPRAGKTTLVSQILH